MKPLQIDEDVFREWVLLYFERMRDMETEILVYRGAVEVLRKQVPPETCETIDRLIEGIRVKPELKKILDAKYQRYREQVLEAIGIGSQDQVLAQYLLEWKAKGPIN